MKSITLDQTENNENYLVNTGFRWSPSGFDIVETRKIGKKTELISQSNGEDLVAKGVVKAIYELPVDEE